jgi:hypothetical protein
MPSNKKSGSHKKGEKVSTSKAVSKTDDKANVLDDDQEPNSGFGHWLRSDEGKSHLEIKIRRKN